MKSTVRELRQTSDGVQYSIQIRGRLPNGQVVRERYTRPFFNVRTANEWARKRIELLILGEDERGPESPTLATLWVDYEKKHIRGQRLKPSQQRALQSLWDNHLGKALGAKRLDAIDYAVIQDFKSSRAGLSPKSVNNCLVALKAMLRFANKTGVLDKLPPIEMLKVPKTTAEYYDIATFNRLVNTAINMSDRHAAIVLLGGEAGLRAGEMLALDAADLQLPMLHVRRTLWRGHMGSTKGNSERVLPLTTRTVTVLERLCTAPGPVLRTSKGTRLNQTMLQRALKQVQDAADLPPLSLHKLRHTYGTDVTRTLGIRAAQVLLGHADVKTTERYSHVLATRGVARALENARAADGQDDSE